MWRLALTFEVLFNYAMYIDNLYYSINIIVTIITIVLMNSCDPYDIEHKIFPPFTWNLHLNTQLILP
jgi:hypothetical protein